MQFIVLTLLLTMLTLTTSAEEITTNNLITNGNFETGNANSWTTTGDVSVLNDCCELNGVSSNYDLEFGNSGSIEQQFNLSSDTITQDILNNGITLNSTVEVQNGECGVAGCWGGQGGADSFTITLKIKDANGNVLATTTNVRTNITDINGANFQDTLIYTGENSNLGNLNIAGTDANAPSNLGGPNIDNISVTMTYDNVVIATEIQEEIKEIESEINEVIKSFIYETFKEESIEFETMPEELEVMAAEITAEIIEEVKESFKPPMMASMPEEEPEFIEEATEIVEEIIKEESTETISNVQEKEQVEKESEIKTEEKEESNSQESTTEVVSTKSNTKQKKVQSKKTINIDKVMEKVDAQVKDIAKNLVVKSIIKLDAMTDDQESLSLYSNKEFYKPKDIYLNQLNIIDNRLIYTNVTLNNYIANDTIGIKQRTLQELNINKQRILLELQELKNG